MVVAVVASAVTQIDASHESDVQLGVAGMAQHQKLLVMRSTGADPHVQQAAPTHLIDLLTQVAVLGSGERHPVPV